MSIAKESARGVHWAQELGLKVGVFFEPFPREYCQNKKRASKVPMAKSALRRAIVFLRDQTASNAVLMKMIKALKMEKERFEPIGFI